MDSLAAKVTSEFLEPNASNVLKLTDEILAVNRKPERFTIQFAFVRKADVHRSEAVSIFDSGVGHADFR